MKRSKWEDHEIERLLKEMPKPSSRTSAEEMYEAIQSRRIRKARRPLRVIPALAGLAALLLLVLIVPVFLSTTTEQSDQQASTADSGAGTTEMMTQSVEEDSGGATEDSGGGSEQADTAAENDSAAAVEEGRAEEEPADSAPADDSGEQERPESSVPEEEPAENPVQDLPSSLEGSGIVVANEQPVAALTLGLVTPDQFVVPVTVELPSANRTGNTADLYNEWAAEVDETALGFLDVHPVRGTAEQLDDTLVFTVEEDAPLLMSDVSDGALNDVLQLFTKNELDSVSFQNNESEPVERDPFGSLTMNKVEAGPSAYYVYRVNDQPYYMSVPASGTTPSEVFGEMQSAPNDFFEPAIPEELVFTVEEESGQLTVTIRETGKEVSAESTVQMVESMLLTAKSLGYGSVLFNGLATEEISGFPVSEPIPVPLYENVMVYP